MPPFAELWSFSPAMAYEFTIIFNCGSPLLPNIQSIASLALPYMELYRF